MSCTPKPERRAARRTQRRECQRHGTAKTARRIRDGWGPIIVTACTAEGRPVAAPVRFFGKVTADYERRPADG